MKINMNINEIMKPLKSLTTYSISFCVLGIKNVNFMNHIGERILY